MQVKDIKQYIMSVLIHKREKLVICPSLLIDRLFDNLDVDRFEAIKGHMTWGSDTEQMQRVWDRYLLPVLMMTDLHVQVFARD